MLNSFVVRTYLVTWACGLYWLISLHNHELDKTHGWSSAVVAEGREGQTSYRKSKLNDVCHFRIVRYYSTHVVIGLITIHSHPQRYTKMQPVQPSFRTADKGYTLKGKMCTTCDVYPSTGQEAFRVCSGCKIAVYCSKACQRTAWKSHKYVKCMRVRMNRLI
jgi:MYND finger